MDASTLYHKCIVRPYGIIETTKKFKILKICPDLLEYKPNLTFLVLLSSTWSQSPFSSLYGWDQILQGYNPWIIDMCRWKIVLRHTIFFCDIYRSGRCAYSFHPWRRRPLRTHRLVVKFWWPWIGKLLLILLCRGRWGWWQHIYYLKLVANSKKVLRANVFPFPLQVFI